MASSPPPLRHLRAALLVALGPLACAGTWLLAREPVLALTHALTHGPLDLQTVIVGGCAGALLGCALWLTAVTTLVAVAYVAGGVAAAERRCPVVLRRLVALLLGAAMTAGGVGPALADSAGVHGLDGLRVPERTTGTMPARPAAQPAAQPVAQPVSGSTLLVRPGDSLWSLAAGVLRPGATDGEITSAWHRLHRANAARIGPDPDLILPGTRLVLPDLTAPLRKEAS